MKPRLPELNVPLDRRVGWVDLLRVIACFLVVFSHCCDPFVAAFDTDRATFLQGVAAGSLVRACVPLFVMMTAVLLLPVRMETGAFYRKRLGRILLALVFWSLLLPVLYYLYMRYVGTSSPSIDPALFTGEATLRKLWTFVFNFTYDTTPLWYLYMLAGLYFIMPVISPWLERASRRELRLVLAIWAFTLLLPYVRIAAPLLGYPGNYGNMGLYGECDWNVYGTFYYVSGFAGYLVLAFYLTKFPPAWSWRRMLAFCIPSFAVGYLVTSLGFVEMQRHFPGNYAYLEIIWYFAGINVFLMTAPVFLIVQKAAARPRPWLARLAGATFGIYLCHFIFVQGAYDLVQCIPGLPALVRIPLMALCAFAVSYAVVWLLQRWRVTRRFVQ
ncbi:acyltransferase family protein [uncultured Alistipes sp.]|uniref:acyltransferase n=1 Tax=uncultured Alistipes sp. TaxID=538949 RepID=UPI0026272353|nr:acyltransferase family protein [uncultured Alistipes sp.]